MSEGLKIAVLANAYALRAAQSEADTAECGSAALIAYGMALRAVPPTIKGHVDREVAAFGDLTISVSTTYRKPRAARLAAWAVAGFPVRASADGKTAEKWRAACTHTVPSDVATIIAAQPGAHHTWAGGKPTVPGPRVLWRFYAQLAPDAMVTSPRKPQSLTATTAARRLLANIGEQVIEDAPGLTGAQHEALCAALADLGGLIARGYQLASQARASHASVAFEEARTSRDALRCEAIASQRDLAAELSAAQAEIRRLMGAPAPAAPKAKAKGNGAPAAQ